MKKLSLLLISLFFLSGKSDSEIVAECNWKYISGYRVSDWLSNLAVKDDTVYSGEKPIAILVSTEYYIDHYTMKILSLDRKREGLYTAK